MVRWYHARPACRGWRSQRGRWTRAGPDHAPALAVRIARRATV